MTITNANELNLQDLDQVSGGYGPYVPPWVRRDQEAYEKATVLAAIQKDVNNMRNMGRDL
jgi:hypothetical protein